MCVCSPVCLSVFFLVLNHIYTYVGTHNTGVVFSKRHLQMVAEIYIQMYQTGMTFSCYLLGVRSTGRSWYGDGCTGPVIRCPGPEAGSGEESVL